MTQIPDGDPVQKAAKAFGESILPPSCNGDYQETFRENWKKAAEFGLFKLLIPEGKLDSTKVFSTLEGLGEGCENGGFLLALGAHCFGVGAPLVHFGQKSHRNLLSSLRDGTAVAALAATEPEAGSDVMSLATLFQADGENYVLQGTKCFITNVQDADIFLVLATKDPRLHFRGISAFLVPSNTPGLAVRNQESRLGLHGCSIGTLCLNNVVIPKSALLGRVNDGAALLRHAMIWERSLIVATHVGAMRRQLLNCLARAKSRHQFGRPIGSKQYVAGRIVDLLLRYTTSCLLVKDTLTKLAAGKLTAGEASLTKLYVSEAEIASSLDALRIYGGQGYMNEFPVSNDLRNSLGAIVYSGTSDMQRVIIAAELGLVD
jgi:alkylation response protein AidB-like acyl-CoA dehydrogenase